VLQAPAGYRKTTLAPDEDQGRSECDCFVAWLTVCREIGSQPKEIRRQNQENPNGVFLAFLIIT
jgi:ATP/maltotriose-dependent transcriptional regulator MalT